MRQLFLLFICGSRASGVIQTAAKDIRLNIFFTRLFVPAIRDWKCGIYQDVFFGKRDVDYLIFFFKFFSISSKTTSNSSALSMTTVESSEEPAW
jgi:hypothetical protein